MSVMCVVGTQWGDEGKGKIVDYVSSEADFVIRFQGSDNAGHSVINQYGEFGLHLIPSGIFHTQATNLLGPGTGINVESFMQELASLRKSAPELEMEKRILIAERAHVIMPYHLSIDSAEEEGRGELVQGTTRRGNGPVYSDKTARSGVVVADLFEEEYLRRYLPHVIRQKNLYLEAVLGADPVDAGEMIERCLAWGEQIRPYVVDSFPIIKGALEQNKNIVLEGQLGIMRDLDWGHYPYVTSSSPSAGGASTGAGISPNQIDKVIGVAKAFTSSVGEGPFPTELNDEVGEKLRIQGQEFGVSTGRPRRVGWMDTVAVKFASALNGLTGLALTKIDLLDSFRNIPICTAYKVRGKQIDWVPNTHQLYRAEPVYEELPGWNQPTAGISEWEDLPPEAQNYVLRIEEHIGVPVQFIGTGRHRDNIIARNHKI